MNLDLVHRGIGSLLRLLRRRPRFLTSTLTNDYYYEQAVALLACMHARSLIVTTTMNKFLPIRIAAETPTLALQTITSL